MATVVEATLVGTTAPGQIVMNDVGARLEAHLSKYQKLFISPLEGNAAAPLQAGVCELALKCTIADEAGKPVFDVFVSCPNRSKGHIDCVVKPAGGTQPLINIVRKEFKWGQNVPADVLIDEQPYGHARVSAGMGGGKCIVERDGVDQMAAKGVCLQKKCGAIICAFLLFFPTLTIGTCVCLCYSSTVPSYMKLDGGDGKDFGKVWTRKGTIELDMTNMNALQKSDVLVMQIFFACNEVCKPVANAQGNGASGQ